MQLFRSLGMNVHTLAISHTSEQNINSTYEYEILINSFFNILFTLLHIHSNAEKYDLCWLQVKVKIFTRKVMHTSACIFLFTFMYLQIWRKRRRTRKKSDAAERMKAVKWFEKTKRNENSSCDTNHNVIIFINLNKLNVNRIWHEVGMNEYSSSRSSHTVGSRAQEEAKGTAIISFQLPSIGAGLIWCDLPSRSIQEESISEAPFKALPSTVCRTRPIALSTAYME